MKTTKRIQTNTTPDDSERLMKLFQAIASRDSRKAFQLLKQTPSLATNSLKVGASREQSNDYILTSLRHYAYGGDTALHIAAAAYQLEIAKQLVADGASVRAKNRRGAEPLHYACDGTPDSPGWNPDAQSAVVSFLIEAGANPDAVDKSGVGPLHRAVRTRCTAAVRALLEGGVDSRRANKSGSRPLHLAVQNTGRGGSGSTSARREQEQIIRLLLSHGARPNNQDANGKTVHECTTADWIQSLLKEFH